jgi:hypothetical protein
MIMEYSKWKTGDMIKFSNGLEQEKVLILSKCDPQDKWFSNMKGSIGMDYMAVVGIDYQGKEWGLIVNKVMKPNHEWDDDRITICERWNRGDVDDGRWMDSFDGTFSVPDVPDWTGERISRSKGERR